MLEALQQYVGAEHQPKGTLPEVTEALLVWAHGAGIAGGIGSEHGGLQALQTIIANQSSQVKRYLVTGFLPASGFGEWNYLVAGGAYCQLPGSGLPAPETWSEVPGSAKRTAAEREMEVICSRIRHMFVDDARPAARIALGAYACADVSFDALTGTLRHLRLRDHAKWQAVQATCVCLRKEQVWPRWHASRSWRRKSPSSCLLPVTRPAPFACPWRRARQTIFSLEADLGQAANLVMRSC